MLPPFAPKEGDARYSGGSTFRRLDVSPENSTDARVIVNRVLATLLRTRHRNGTPSDFGLQRCSAETHPGLTSMVGRRVCGVGWDVQSICIADRHE